MLGGPVAVSGLRRDSVQGDRIIERLFRTMGGSLRWQDHLLIAESSQLRGIVADVSQCPDLAPALAAAMAVAEGNSRITGGVRLRDKESDRIRSIADALNALGADVRETADGLEIHGRPLLRGGAVQSCNDHRIAMMTAAVSPRCGGMVNLHGFEAVSKSWPGFWDTFRVIGGNAFEQPMG
jgi:3-phosphoshikimate 1-carboxyvinyltransferase